MGSFPHVLRNESYAVLLHNSPFYIYIHTTRAQEVFQNFIQLMLYICYKITKLSVVEFKKLLNLEKVDDKQQVTWNSAILIKISYSQAYKLLENKLVFGPETYLLVYYGKEGVIRAICDC